MTYPIFLVIFLLAPIAVLGVRWRRDIQQRWWQHTVIAMTITALIYTTPWDNFLVGTRVWYYDPARVWNVVLGYVPLEEYLFFILQVLLTSLITLRLIGRTRHHG